MKINEIIDDALISLLGCIEKRMKLNKFELTKLVKTPEYKTELSLKYAAPLRQQTTSLLRENISMVTEPKLVSTGNKNTDSIVKTDVVEDCQIVNCESVEIDKVVAPKTIDPSPER